MLEDEVAVINEVEDVEMFVMFQFPLINDGDSNLKNAQVDGEHDEGSDDIEEEERRTKEEETSILLALKVIEETLTNPLDDSAVIFS